MFRFDRLSLLLFFCLSGVFSVADERLTAQPIRNVSSVYSVPLAFVPNVGEAGAGIDYVTDLPGYKFQIRHDGFDLLRGGCSELGGSAKRGGAIAGCGITESESTISVRLQGANSTVASTATDTLPGKHNFLAGLASNWRQNLPGYGRLHYKDVYPGIDLAYHAATGRPTTLEYDFEMSPDADAAKIRLHFGGREPRIGHNGELTLGAESSDPLRWLPPTAYQWIGGERRTVPVRYVAYGSSEVGFRLGAYDHRHSIVIDPALAYSQMLPPNLIQMKADPSGAVYLLFLPPTAAFMKIQADGTPGFTTALPGWLQNPPPMKTVFTVDQSGAAYFTGETAGGLPVTSGVLQATLGGGDDAFAAKLAPSGGSFDYVTYYGGPGTEWGSSIAVDSTGNAYIAGGAIGVGLPTTVGAYKPVPDNPADTNVWIAKINSSGSQLDYATFVGDVGIGSQLPRIAFDASSGSAVITGTSTVSTFPYTAGAYNNSSGAASVAFVTKIKSDGTGLTYSALFSSPFNISVTSIPSGLASLAVDGSGAAYISGLADSTWPTTPGAYEQVFPSGANATAGFVTKLDSSGSTLAYSTYVDISGGLEPTVVVDGGGSAYVGGSSSIPNAKVVNPIQATAGGTLDAFVDVLNPAGSNLSFATYLGGTLGEQLNFLDVDSSQNIYVAGTTSGNAFPFISGSETPQSGGGNWFLAKITPSGGAVGVLVPPFNSSISPVVPGAIAFGTTAVGSSAPSQTLVFGNYGGAALNIGNIATSGDFSQTNNCPSTLQPGANCQLTVTFTPTATGARAGSVTITDNAGSGSQQAPLSGSGIASALTLAPTTLNFGTQAVGTSSSPQTVTVMNSGSANLMITAIAVQGDFSQTNTCGGAVVPQATCTIAVTFTPTAAGVRTGGLSLTDNVSGSPQRVPLAGNTDFVISSTAGSSSSAIVAAGQTATYSLSLTPSGFSGTVSLSCTGAPTGANCSIPASAQLTASTPTVVSVSVSTTARATGMLQPAPKLSPWLWATATFGLVGLLFKKPAANRRLRTIACVIGVGMILCLGSCGGGSSSPPGPNPNGTPAGNYALMVTAAAGTTSHSMTLMLTVQ